MRNKVVTSVLVLAIALLPWACFGCGIANLGKSLEKSVDTMVAELEKYRGTIEKTEGAWRDQLSQLVTDLNGLESQVSADAQGLLRDTTNQVQNLATETIKLSDAAVSDAIHQTGAELRCNADFVKEGTLEQLQYLIDDLKFWKTNKMHLVRKPIHHVCAIAPSELSLYPSGNGWLIKTGTMLNPNIVTVYGYNFRSDPDALPTLELQNASGQKVRNVNLTAAYVTQYQINLDFSTENFQGVDRGWRVGFSWSDKPEFNTINLLPSAPAKLKISSPVFEPSSPIKGKDSVMLKVTVTNVGDSKSDEFTVVWQPDPEDETVRKSSLQDPLEPNQSRDVSVEKPYVYQNLGEIESVVSVSSGTSSVSIRPKLVVQAEMATTTLDYGNIRWRECGGGGGGNEILMVCPPLFVVTGLEVRAGALIDQIRLRCSFLMPDGTTITPLLLAPAGGTGGMAYHLLCLPNEALTSISVRSGAMVDQLQGHCSFIGELMSVYDTGVAGGTGGTSSECPCPSTWVITGIKVRAGQYIDRLSIMCTEVVKQ